MKNYSITVGLVLATISLKVTAQEISYRTNTILIAKSANITDENYPKIDWKSHRLSSYFIEQGKVEISAKVESKTPLLEVTISISNDNELMGKMVFDLKQDERLQKVISNTIYLMEGSNSVEIIAKTQNGLISTEIKQFIVGSEAISKAVVDNRIDRAILFATDEYDSWSDLANPIFDAETIADELKDSYGFKVEILRNPTAQEILLKLREYNKIAYEPQDQLFIFFAGHGQFESTFGEGFVVAKNSKKDDPTFTSYISHSRLGTIINNIHCEHIFVAMDVCFGGAFSGSASSYRGEEGLYNEVTNEDFIRRKLKYKTRMYLTSGGIEYVSDGIPGKHSPFGRSFISALRNYGGRDRILTLSELRVYVEKLDPQPKFGEFGDNEPGGDFIFVVK